MEDPSIYNEWRIKDLEKENAELKNKIILLGDMVLKAKDLANKVRLNYPACTKSTYLMAKEFLES